MENDKEVRIISDTQQENKDEKRTLVLYEPSTRDRRTSIASAIVIAGIFVGGAIYFSRGNHKDTTSSQKTTVQQLGINQDRFSACVASGRHKKTVQIHVESATRAMSHIADGLGTPYSFALAKDGRILEIPGALPSSDVHDIIDQLLLSKTDGVKDIILDPVSADDHIIGNRDAEVTIIEYADLDCPYCARFHNTMKDIVKEYDGKVAWVYRHLPLDSIHPTARAKAEASECINELGGNGAFWIYIDKLYELKTPKQDIFQVEEF